jgi:hypothetical protein
MLMRKGRWELAVWLVLIAAATIENATVDLEFASTFARRCLGLGAKPRSTTTSIVARILSRLSDPAMPLIKVVEQRHGHHVLQLLALDGSGTPYTMPHRSKTRVVHIPSELFANGWHQVLTPPQLAALLIAFTEEAYQFSKIGKAMWAKSRDQISRDYGMAPSTWTEAKKELRRVGLIDYDIPGLHVTGRMPTQDQLIDHYRNHRDVLELLPDEAPRYFAFSTPVTIGAPGTGDPLRLHTQQRVRLPDELRGAKVVTIDSARKGGDIR